MTTPHVTWDTETHAFRPGCIAPKIVCVTLTRDGIKPEIYTGADMYDVVDWLLKEPCVVAHSAAFDWAVAMANWPHLTKRIFDAYDEDRIKCTFIREALHVLAIGEMQDHRGNLSLAATYLRRTGRFLSGKKEGEDGVRVNYHKVDGLPLSEWPSDFIEYAMNDPIVTDEIFRHQEDLPDEENQTRAAFALYLMAAVGFRADPERVRILRATLEERVTRMSDLLVPTGLLRPSWKQNLTVTRSMVAEQYIAMGRTIPYVVQKAKDREKEEVRVAEGGTPKTPNIAYGADIIAETPCWGPDDDACDDEKFHVCENPLHRLKARTEDQGELSKYVPHLETATHTAVNASVTSIVSTGRTSMSKPPLQQLPKRYGVRQCIIPPPGHWFIGADFSAIELTTWSQIMLDMFGKSHLAEVIQAGKDPHSVTAAMLLDISYETALIRKADEDDAEFDSIRDLSKALAFGIMGGMGAETFIGYAKGYGYRYKGTAEEQIEQARGHIKTFKNTYPETREYLKRIGQACDSGGGFFDLSQPRSGRIRGQVAFTNAANSGPQGLAADLAKDAIWHITKEMYIPLRTPLFGSRLVIFMHDEMVSRSPIEIAAEAAERQSVLMLEAARRWCPDVPTKAAPWISKCWDKRAKTMRDANGRLMCWEPKEKKEST